VVSIGGNDVNFAGVLKGCIGPDALVAASPLLGPVLAGIVPKCDPVSLADPGSHGDLAVLAKNHRALIDTTLSAVRATFPDAKIVVQGYPNILPAPMPPTLGVLPASETPPGCTPLGSLRELNTLWSAVNSATADVVAAHPGMTFIDTSPMFAGHDICSSDPYGWGLSGLLNSPLANNFMSAFHPNSAGQTELTKALIKAMEHLAAGTDVTQSPMPIGATDPARTTNATASPPDAPSDQPNVLIDGDGRTYVDGVLQPFPAPIDYCNSQGGGAAGCVPTGVTDQPGGAISAPAPEPIADPYPGPGQDVPEWATTVSATAVPIPTEPAPVNMTLDPPVVDDPAATATIPTEPAPVYMTLDEPVYEGLLSDVPRPGVAGVDVHDRPGPGVRADVVG
jgi:GDSL-like Lipase/Acylhydrolase family